MKAVITWDNGIEIVFTDVFKYLDYLEKLWDHGYRDGYDYNVEEIFDE